MTANRTKETLDQSIDTTRGAIAPDGGATAHSQSPAVHRFSGSPFDVGRQQGEQFRPAILCDLADKAAAAGGREDLALKADRMWQLHRSCYERFVPQSLEEIRGVAAGAGVSFELAFLISHETGGHPALGDDGCSSIVVPAPSSKTATVLIGQNKDTHRNPREHLLVHKTYSDGRQELLLTYAGWIGNIGISTTGVGICGNSLTAAEPQGEVLCTSLIWRILQETGRVEDMVAVLNEFPFINGSVLVGQRDSGAWCVEHAAGKHSILRSEERPFARANTILSADLRQLEQRPLTSASSDFRQHRMEEMIATQSELDLNDLQTIFSDHRNFPLSICRHPDPSETITTTACYTADIHNGIFQYCHGNPCDGVWTTVRFD